MQLQIGRFRLQRVTVTNVLAAITTLVSIVITATGNEVNAAFAGGFMPARVGGADLPAGWWGVPVWLTPLSATLIHGGVMHLALNMVMLFFAGRSVEQALGWRFTLLIYVVGAYAAAAAQWAAVLWLPGQDAVSPMVGASGAISALIGAYALLFSRPKTRAIGPIPALLINAVWLLVAWTILNYALALVFTVGGSSLAWAAHVGGFIAGLVMARPLLLARYRRA